MKKIITYLLFIVLVFACQQNNEDLVKPAGKKENLVEVKNGIYTEWYPGKKSKKFEGAQDEKYRRNGKWTFYSEGGTELSITFYSN